MRFRSMFPKSMTDGVARGLLAVLALVHLTCNQAILTAPDDATLRLFANPEFIPAHGGVSIISAFVFEKIGTPVADGTVVQFFTNLGTIEEQGKTNDGVARVKLIADSRSGEATVRAFSGGIEAEDDVKVRIGGGIPPAKILLRANPERLVEQRASLITATVVDADGNPVPNVAVFFSIRDVSSTPPPTPTPTPGPSPAPRPTPTPSPTPRPPERDEFMESRGSPVFTDNNGQATDVLRTNRPRDGWVHEITVVAEVAARNVAERTIIVFVN